MAASPNPQGATELLTAETDPMNRTAHHVGFKPKLELIFRCKTNELFYALHDTHHCYIFKNFVLFLVYICVLMWARL